MKVNEKYSKAVEFVKKFGLDAFRLSVSSVSTRKYLVVYEDEIDFTDEIKPSHGKCVFDRMEVKRLVNSYNVVERCGGLEKAKLRCYLGKHLSLVSYYRLKQAIADVESCK